MMTTLRSQRRIQRTTEVHLEHRDDRIVPSAMGAEGHLFPAPAAALVRHDGKVLGRIETPYRVNLADAGTAARGTLGAVPFATKHPVLHPRHKPGGFLPLNVDAHLRVLYSQYQAYVRSNVQGTFTPTGVSGLVISGTSVVVRLRAVDTNSFQTYVGRLRTSELKITQLAPRYRTIVGLLPIAKLPAVASLHGTVSVSVPTTGSAQLASLYAQYETWVSKGSSGTFSPTGVSSLEISGTNVAINVHTNDLAEFSRILAQLQSDGLQVSEESAR
jgi:hypothetical protein